jgi:hypothetical protein
MPDLEKPPPPGKPDPMAEREGPTEDIMTRRTPGRSEEPETLEQQLEEGLEDSFPASDPPAVVSTTIAGRCKPVKGTDEVLRERKNAR